MTDPPRTVRVFRVKDGRSRLLLDDGERLLDLSAHLMERGQPTDLPGLFEAGWFDAKQLGPRLPGGGRAESEAWTAADVEWDGNAPPDVEVPIDPHEVGKILCLGKNFHAHAQEFDEEPPSEPLFFDKLPETLTPHRAEVRVPSWYTERVDHEVELAVVIGLVGHDISVEDAMEHVAGYTVANDLTARSLQGADREHGHPWFRSKNLDGFCPVGPCFVPRDFLDPGDLSLTARVGDEPRQDASTRDWIVDVPHAVAFLSRHLTLHPGDLILMGTPAGVGPLADGDVVTCAVEGIGQLETVLRRP